MSKKTVCCILTAVILIMMSSCALSNKGETENKSEEYLVSSVTSPTGEYIVNAYRYKHGTRYTVKCELYICKDESSKDIYWNFDGYDINIKWLNNEVVEINDIWINVLKDVI